MEDIIIECMCVGGKHLCLGSKGKNKVGTRGGMDCEIFKPECVALLW